MHTLRLSLVGTVTMALLGGMGGAVVAQSEESDTAAFPAGTFVSVENGDLSVEFNKDGTGRWHSYVENWEVADTYAVNGDLWTEMTFDYPEGRQVPATYYWHFDGQHLTFELWGEDLRPHRNFVMTGNTWTLLTDPREVVVAVADIPAGDGVSRVTLRLVPAAEAGPDAFTTAREAMGSIAAVPISKGQPITPDLLEPPE